MARAVYVFGMYHSEVPRPMPLTQQGHSPSRQPARCPHSLLPDALLEGSPHSPPWLQPASCTLPFSHTAAPGSSQLHRRLPQLPAPGWRRPQRPPLPGGATSSRDGHRAAAPARPSEGSPAPQRDTAAAGASHRDAPAGAGPANAAAGYHRDERLPARAAGGGGRCGGDGGGRPLPRRQAPPACGRAGSERRGGEMAASLGRAAAGLLTRLQTSAPTIRTLSSSNSFSQNIPSCLWKLGRLNHVAIAVPDLEKAQSLYKDVLGAQVSETVALPEHGVYTVFVELGNTKLELLHPLGEKSPIASFLQKNKTGGMHHICIEVDDIKAAMTELKKKKIRILSEEPKIGAHGKPVIFLHPKDCHGVLVELEQA